MKRYIARRLWSLLPVLFVVATVVFFLVHLTPGDPASVILGADATPEALAELRARLGLDKPLLLQFARWCGRMLRGDLGESIFLRRPVTQAIAERLEPTFLLAGLATLFAVLIGIPTGVLAAVYHNSWLDRLFMTVAIFGVAMPNFWLGLNLIFLCPHPAAAARVGLRTTGRQPLANPALPVAAGLLARLPAVGAHCPHDAWQYARRVVAGLHQDGTRQGATRDAGHLQACAEKHHDHRADGGGHCAGHHAQRLGGDRNGLWPARYRALIINRYCGGTTR